jgi:hypothetical protein
VEGRCFPTQAKPRWATGTQARGTDALILNKMLVPGCGLLAVGLVPEIGVVVEEWSDSRGSAALVSAEVSAEGLFSTRAAGKSYSFNPSQKCALS